MDQICCEPIEYGGCS